MSGEENENIPSPEEIPSTSDHLESFREEWKKELAVEQSLKTAEGQRNRSKEEEDEEESIHLQAREYFLQGVQFEENGKLYDAIKYYKKAIALVPDIEREAFIYTRKQAKSSTPKERSVESSRENTDPDQGEAELQNLISKFAAINLDNQCLIQPEFSQEGTHIGRLPLEVLNYILKWVVSADLDLRSLEACSEVCRGFYLAARDNEIWRCVCKRVWGPTVVANLGPELVFRDTFINRPRIHFNGCYTSKMTYIREGERGFQDHESYRSWHVVQYYRFLRFFPGGRLLMCISAEDPGLTVKLMNNRNFCSIQGSMFGEYRIKDNVVFCVLHKSKPKKIINKFANRKKKKQAMDYYEAPDQDFLLELTIKGKRALHWKSYKIVSKYKDGRESIEPVNLNDKNYPRMLFSRVGSYHLESNAPLS